MYRDRADAGRQLAGRLLHYQAEHPLVLALPRGGVPVGYEIALALDAPLDIIIVRKLGAPGQPELGIGAVVDGEHPQSVLNEDVVQELRVTPEYLRYEIEAQLHEIRRRQQCYRGGQPRPPIEGRTVIVVDDGIATGGSMRAALRGLRRARPKRLVLAVPVAPLENVDALRLEVDELVCLTTPAFFQAVGQFYADFSQTSDEEVIRLLRLAQQRQPSAEKGAPRAVTG